MAALIEMEEAARLLGLTEDELRAMLSRNEIFGYRDGASWKFKMQELERVADERGVELGGEAPVHGGSGIDDDLEELTPVSDLDDEDEESVLVSEEELGASSGEAGASTIIGGDKGAASEDSDIRLADSETKSKAEGGSGSGKGSDVELVLGEGGSDLQLIAGSDVLEGEAGAGGPTDTGDLVQGDDELDDDLELELDDDFTENLGAEATERLEVQDELELDEESGGEVTDDSLTGGTDVLSVHDDLTADDESPTQLAPSAADSGSALELGEDEDDLVLGSGAGSDVTLGAGDSGIGLSSPTDSGLSLEEEPVELGGSQVESLELGEDDMIELEGEAADNEAPTQLKADDDFLLTPVDDLADDESDSGSQVIALDTEQFDDSADTMLGAADLLEEEADLMGAAPADDALGAGAPAMAAQPMMQPAQALPEAKYSVWNVLSLMVVVLLLCVCGMMMVDLLRNMWQWDQSLAANRPLMDYVLSLIPE